MPAVRREPRAEDIDLWAASLEVFEAGQQVVADRVALVRATLVDDLTLVGLVFAFALPSVVLGLLGVVGLAAAITLALSRVMSTEVALAVVSVGALIGCGVLAALAARYLRSLWQTQGAAHG